MAFEAVLAGPATTPKRWRRATVAVSLALHVTALAVGVAYSFWSVDELPLPAVAVTLAGGLPAPPPPPPAAARRKSSATRSRPKTVETPTVDPRSRPAQPEPADSAPAPKDEGQAGGVPGGVQGGVAGGVVGAPVGPATVTARVASAQLLIDPNVDPYKVRLPPALARADASFHAIVRVCVSEQGNVSEVRVLRGADPAIDPQIPAALGRWRYRPYLVNGRPTPFCYMLRYEVSAR